MFPISCRMKNVPHSRSKNEVLSSTPRQTFIHLLCIAKKICVSCVWHWKLSCITCESINLLRKIPFCTHILHTIFGLICLFFLCFVSPFFESMLYVVFSLWEFSGVQCITTCFVLRAQIYSEPHQCWPFGADLLTALPNCTSQNAGMYGNDIFSPSFHCPLGFFECGCIVFFIVCHFVAGLSQSDRGCKAHIFHAFPEVHIHAAFAFFFLCIGLIFFLSFLGGGFLHNFLLNFFIFAQFFCFFSEFLVLFWKSHFCCVFDTLLL